MLMPRKTKYRKIQRGTMRGRSKGCRTVHFGSYGLQAVEPCWMTAQQIESMRVAISRFLKKEGKYHLRIFPDKPFTKKPAETRMGKGKGNPEGWVAVIKRGRIICEIEGLSDDQSKNILKAASYKLPIKTLIVARKDLHG